MRLMRLPAADRGMLVIRLEEKRPLGRMTVADEAGNPLMYLVDNMNNREKSFVLPASLGEQGMRLQDAAGNVLFSYGIEEKQASEPPQQEAETPAESPLPDDAILEGKAEMPG